MALRWGILGAAGIADGELLPALRAAAGAEPLAIASRDPQRALRMAVRHSVPRVHQSYEALLADPEVDAVYVALSNDAHHPWTLRALAAGKHVLCEKPLALDAAQGEEMAAAAQAAGRLLMEAFMYRFLPRTQQVVASLEGRAVRHLHAAFGFTIRDAGNYRMRAALGGGALYDVGCYCADLARWVLGEPDGISADMRGDEVDMSTGALLHFESGATATLFASFESAEHQSLEVITDSDVVRIEKPFGAREEVNPYQQMVEEFTTAAVGGGTSPLPVAWSIANLRVLDAIRAAARRSGRDSSPLDS